MDDDQEAGCSDSAKVLPFFPKYETELICQDKLRITWFEVDFCQSRYNFDHAITGSNACTVIAILAVTRCHKENISMFGPEKSPSCNLIKAMGLAMLDGNYIHTTTKEKGMLPNVNLTIPEAIKLAGKRASRVKEWKSMVYMQSLQKTLPTQMRRYWDEWRKCSHSKRHPDLYVVLVTNSRSALFVFSESMDSVTLVDTHQHTGTKGACIGVVRLQNLRCLCAWMTHIISKYYHSLPNLYELSFLYFRKKKITM